MSPSALINANGAEYASGRCVSPLAYMFPCVRFACLVRLNPFRTSISATHATLGMGGWLILTQPGLSPGKKRQASLDARHGRTASRPAAPAQIPACGTTAPGSSVILVSHKDLLQQIFFTIPCLEVGTHYLALHIQCVFPLQATYYCWSLSHVNGSPVLDGWGHSKGAIVTFDDVTELERKSTALEEALAMLEKSQDEIRLRNEELQVLAKRDPLTGVANPHRPNGRLGVHGRCWARLPVREGTRERSRGLKLSKG